MSMCRPILEVCTLSTLYVQGLLYVPVILTHKILNEHIEYLTTAVGILTYEVS